jgi:hypothetical protein
VRQPSLYLRQQWRTNTAALAGLTLVGLVVVGFALWRLVPSTPGPQATASQTADDYRLSHEAISLSGTREKLFVLEHWKSGGAGGAAVNLLIVNSDDATSRWMFPDNGQTILSRDELHGSDGSFAPVTGLVLTVGARGSEKPRESLYFYRVGGGPAVRFLTVDTIISADQAGSDRYLVLARKDGRTTAALYSLIDFRVLAEKPAPDIP